MIREFSKSGGGVFISKLVGQNQVPWHVVSFSLLFSIQVMRRPYNLIKLYYEYQFIYQLSYNISTFLSQSLSVV